MENIGKRKKNQLEQDEGTIVGEDNLKIYITEYYKKLFGEPKHTSVSMVEDWVQDIPQVSAEENALLTADFKEDEVFEAISQMEHNKAPGPDGSPAECYQHFWKIVKNDLTAMFHLHHNG